MTQCYYLQKTTLLDPSASWLDSSFGVIAPDGASTVRTFGDVGAPMRFYRVQAVRPLP